MSKQKEPQLRRLLDDRQCRLFLKDMQEFGYPKLTFEEVRRVADSVAMGTYEPTDVIAAFLVAQLDEIEAPY